jgi:hypothetical protein
MPLNISRILGTTLLMFLLVGILQGLYGYDESKTRENKYKEQINYVHELEWQLIESVITDNYNNADLFATNIKTNIESKLLRFYNNKFELQYDLDNPNPNSAIYVISTQEVKGKYLNEIYNDNNDPFVASRKGIISDLSLNCSADESPIRTWEKEMSMHANPPLASRAINAITTQINKPIFWEYRPSTNPKHIMISEMDLKELHNVFMIEGLEGLQTYEFLKPVYIQQYSDIFGVPDVNNIGVRQPNSKIIVISGFNIHDILLKYHKTALSTYETALLVLERDYNDELRHSNFVRSFMSIIILFCIIITAVINNYVVITMQKDNESSESGESTE